jgi:hypothetical protein
VGLIHHHSRRHRQQRNSAKDRQHASQEWPAQHFHSVLPKFLLIEIRNNAIPRSHRRQLLCRAPVQSRGRAIGTHFLQTPFGNTLNRQKVVNFPKGAAVWADIYDGFCGAEANTGYLLRLVCGGGVQIDGMRWRQAFGVRVDLYDEQCHPQKRNRE